MLLLQLGYGESQMLDKPLYEGVKRCMACFHFPLCFEDYRGGGDPPTTQLFLALNCLLDCQLLLLQVLDGDPHA